MRRGTYFSCFAKRSKQEKATPQQRGLRPYPRCGQSRRRLRDLAYGLRTVLAETPPRLFLARRR